MVLASLIKIVSLFTCCRRTFKILLGLNSVIFVGHACALRQLCFSLLSGFKIGCESQSVFRYNSKGFRTSVFVGCLILSCPMLPLVTDVRPLQAYYFALCDIHARGYMRQFCMVYCAEDYE